jgi:hypothetical protein
MKGELFDKTYRLRVALSLWALLLLFTLRVIGQLLVALGWVSFLPPMTEWQSGLLPYAWLLASQFVIIIVCAKVCADLARGPLVARLRRALFRRDDCALHSDDVARAAASLDGRLDSHRLSSRSRHLYFTRRS